MKTVLLLLLALVPRSHLRQLAIQAEILDPREVHYILVKPEDTWNDLRLLARRAQELEGAPYLWEAERFPSRDDINHLLALNRSYRVHVASCQVLELSHWWELRATLQETDLVHSIWDAARDARCDYYYVTVRRQGLLRLRTAIGSDAFYRGILPEPVPLHRFTELDR